MNKLIERFIAESTIWQGHPQIDGSYFDKEKFAELVRADERESCAQVCEDLIGTRAMARHCADAIRARADDDLYDVWVEQGTCQENQQVAPSGFECPRCGHCCKPDWVGLTDEEIKDIREDLTYDDEDFNQLEFARDIEAKLKEKNT